MTDDRADLKTDEMPVFGHNSLRRIEHNLSRLPAEPLEAPPVDDDYCEFGLGPGDSHYDLSSSFVDFPNDVAPMPARTRAHPQVQSIASARGEQAQAQVRPFPAAATASSQRVSGTELYPRFLDVWARFQLPATLGFGGLALLVVGALLIRALASGQPGDAATSILVVGVVVIIAFVLISLMAAVLNAILTQLNGDLRRMSDELHG
jgi:hypothetical protein